MKDFLKRLFHIHKYEVWGLPVTDYGGSNHQFSSCEDCQAIKRRKVNSIMVGQIAATQIVASLNLKEHHDLATN